MVGVGNGMTKFAARARCRTGLGSMIAIRSIGRCNTLDRTSSRFVMKDVNANIRGAALRGGVDMVKKGNAVSMHNVRATASVGVCNVGNALMRDLRIRHGMSLSIPTKRCVLGTGGSMSGILIC